MKILLYGATGTLGSRIAAELVSRDHAVTAAVRSPERAAGLDPRLASVVSDVTDAAGDSRVSAEDFAVALADIVESGEHAGTRVTIAY